MNNAGEWNVADIVLALHTIREQSMGGGGSKLNFYELPSRKVLQEILESLISVLFPNLPPAHVIAKEDLDHFVATTLEKALSKLLEQLLLEMTTATNHGENPATIRERCRTIATNFSNALPSIRALLETDIQAAYQGDPAAQSVDEVLVCYPGIVANIHYRLAHMLFNQGAKLIARMISELAHSATGIDIHPGARIGESFFIDHGTGVVIGETAIIGKRVRLYQMVTLGAKRFSTDKNGNIVKGHARHPILEDDVVVYAGATILGRITIGQGSVIGGCVWLTRSLPPHSNITQAHVRHELFEQAGGI